MTTIKTIAFILMMQLISGNLIAAITISDTDKKTRPGDGKDKYDPRTKHGESLKGYLYRLYGDDGYFARDVEFKGPFKRKKMKKFLKLCKEHDGYMKEKYTIRRAEETIKARGSWGEKRTSVFVHHITLQTELRCSTADRRVGLITWSAVYLDSDKNSDDGINLYVDYDNCDSDDRAYLEVGEYSIHYDQNPDCTADLSELSE